MTGTLTTTGPRAVSVAMAERLMSYALPFIVVAGLWQLASLFFPPFLFPSLVTVFWRCLEIIGTWSQFADVLATVLRILAGLTGAFLIGCVLAIMMARSRRVDSFISPVLTLFQGIPALSWVVFAIIWFHGIEKPHTVHHDHDDAAGVRVSGAGRASGDVA